MAKTSGGVRGTTAKNRPFANIQTVKEFILENAHLDSWQRAKARYSSDDIEKNYIVKDIIDDVISKNTEFASQVAQTVKKYNYRISEKQAYVIARSAVEGKAEHLYGYKSNQLLDYFASSTTNRRRKSR